MKKNWQIWLIGGLALVWNGFAALDYVMTQSRNADYLAAFTPEQLSFFSNFPLWVNGSWAIAVWFGVLGSFLLLFRSKWSEPIFGFSLSAMVVTSVHNFLIADTKMHEVVGTGAIYFTAVIFVIALALWVYAGHLKKNGILK